MATIKTSLCHFQYFVLLVLTTKLCCSVIAQAEVNRSPSVVSNSESNDADDDISIEDEDDTTQDQNIFKATHEWKVVEDGQSIPPGLHVRMNLQTGLKEAKLLEKDEDRGKAPILKEQPLNGDISDDIIDQGDDGNFGLQTVDLEQDNESSESSDGVTTDEHAPDEHSSPKFKADQRRTHYYGNSDRRGIINKRTKVFSRRELVEMLKSLKEDNTDTAKIHGITSSNEKDGKELSSEGPKVRLNNLEELKSMANTLTFHRDTEIMLEHIQTLTNENSTITDVLHALEELEYYVHQIDNARDLNVIGGLVPIVRLLNHTNPEVRGHAAHVVGSAAQSNPQVQQEVLQYGGLSLLCQLISSSEPEMVQRRSLFAVSALLRGNLQDQQVFVERCQGFKSLGAGYQERSRPVQLKAVILLTDILHEQREEYQQTPAFLLHEILEYGWCQHVATLIYWEQPAQVEKGLLAMEALQNTCNFTGHNSQLHALVKQFRKTLQEESDGFTASLLEHCSELLRTIRQANMDL